MSKKKKKGHVSPEVDNDIITAVDLFTDGHT